MPAPAKVPYCQRPTAAPVGSVMTAIRPRSMTSIGPIITEPPASVTDLRVASMLSVARYVVHTVGGIGSGTVPSGFMAFMIPATGLPWRVQTEYPPVSAGPISPCQPKRSR